MMKRQFAALAAIAGVLLPLQAQAKEPLRVVAVVVQKVADGDTVTAVDAAGTKLKVRLYGIDAPETTKANRKTGRVSKQGQPWGEEAQQALSQKVLRQAVEIRIMDVDRYRRMVATLMVQGRRDINREMVQEGHAWAYRQYLDRAHASEYIRAEEEARRSRRGLWQQSNPQPPWEFRKLQRIRGE